MIDYIPAFIAVVLVIAINSGIAIYFKRQIESKYRMNYVVNAIKLINRCIKQGDHVELHANYAFEKEYKEENPTLVVNVWLEDDPHKSLFHTSFEGSDAILAWYRVTRENGFKEAGSKHIEFNTPEKELTTSFNGGLQL